MLSDYQQSWFHSDIWIWTKSVTEPSCLPAFPQFLFRLMIPVPVSGLNLAKGKGRISGSAADIAWSHLSTESEKSLPMSEMKLRMTSCYLQGQKGFDVYVNKTQYGLHSHQISTQCGFYWRWWWCCKYEASQEDNIWYDGYCLSPPPPPHIVDNFNNWKTYMLAYMCCTFLLNHQ